MCDHLQLHLNAAHDISVNYSQEHLPSLLSRTCLHSIVLAKIEYIYTMRPDICDAKERDDQCTDPFHVPQRPGSGLLTL